MCVLYISYTSCIFVENIQNMATISFAEKKRKNIDIPVEALRKLSIMAAAQGTSVKAFIENILVSAAQSLDVTVYQNPSPSGDKWFNESTNLEEVDKRIKRQREGKTQIAVTLKSTEEMKDFINNL